MKKTRILLMQQQNQLQQISCQRNMAADFTQLKKAIDDLTSQITSNVTIEGGATALINKIADMMNAAVAAALTADAAANQGSIDAAAVAINGVRDAALASATPLSAALTANTPAAQPGQ